MLARAGIFTPDSTLNRTTEEFRLIKRAVLERAGKAQADGVANANLVMVTSTREGEGKTFVALNLAFGLAAEQGRSVMLIDADPTKSSIAQHLGIEVGQGLTDLLQERGPDLLTWSSPPRSKHSRSCHPDGATIWGPSCSRAIEWAPCCRRSVGRLPTAS